MAKLIHELRERLLHAGVAPRHVRRYLAELSDHFADLRSEEQRLGRSRAQAESVALMRLGSTDDLAAAMIAQPRLQSWSARAPWAVFGLGSLFVLAASRLIAFFVLWTGWQMFLPGADTPFGTSHVSWIGNLYFQFGRMIYFGGPLLIGWCISTLAARQRLRTAWPTLGLALIACLAGTSQVEANRSAVAGGFGHINVSFTLGPSVHGVPASLIHAVVIFTLTLLPYLLWRWHQARALPA